MESSMTRRRFVGGVASGAAGAALTGDATAVARVDARTRRRSSRRADVVVIGAGIAGLVAARSVVGAGRSALVVEARERVGGRTLNHPLGASYPGMVAEIGGQWIGPTQNRIRALAESLGIQAFDTYNTGDNVYFRDGQRQRYNAQAPLTGPVPPDPTGVAEAVRFLAQLDQMAAEVPREAPWSAPKAAEWDSQTVETFKQANALTPGGRFLFDVSTQGVFASEPRDLSLLFYLFYISAAGDEKTPGTLERLVNTAGGAQEKRFVGGSQLVSVRVAEQLGRRVLLNSPVRRIVQDRTGVRVEGDGFAIRGKRAIVAIPPTLAGRIDYEPALPVLRDRLTQRFPQAGVIKCEAVYDRPFWRDDGLTGQAVGDIGPVRITYDNSPPDGKPGVLLGFIEGENATLWGQRSPADRKAAVLDNFATYFGEQARRPLDYFEMNWSEERYTRGCYGGVLPPGVLLRFGSAIREPVGRIHWAGTETATIWNGYMDGAVQSGERAAREVLGEL